MLRPDMVVRLPGDKMILIDAKTPLEAFLDAIETEDDEQKRAKLNDVNMLRPYIGIREGSTQCSSPAVLLILNECTYVFMFTS